MYITDSVIKYWYDVFTCVQIENVSVGYKITWKHQTLQLLNLFSFSTIWSKNTMFTAYELSMYQCSFSSSATVYVFSNL